MLNGFLDLLSDLFLVIAGIAGIAALAAAALLLRTAGRSDDA